MNRLLTLLVFIIFTNSLLAQNKFDSIVPHKRLFSSKQIYSSKNVREQVIISNDTLYDNYNFSELEDVNYLNPSAYSYKNIFKTYQFAVFCNSTETSKTVYELKQWNTAIVVYLDPKLPKSIRKAFKTFFSSINKHEIKNLNITFTNNIEKANFYIKTSSETIYTYGEDYVFNKKIDKEESITTGAIYHLLTDNNNKFYSGILSVNPSQSRTETKLLKQLKQMFFISLGHFQFSKYIGKDSLLSMEYNNSNKITEKDIELLRIHYGAIYDQRINGTTFKKLLNIHKE